MPFEMIVHQGRLWEIEGRNLNGYCKLSYSIFWGSKANKIVTIKEGSNICYCFKNTNFDANNKVLRIIDRLFRSIIFIFEVMVICKKNKIDAIVSQSNALREPEIACLLTSKIFNIPVLGHIGRNFVGFSNNAGFLKKKIHQLEKTILKNTDRVIVRPGSEKMISDFFHISPSKLVVIPHRTKIDQLSDKIDIPDDIREWTLNKKIILYYGRMNSDKLVDDIIKSFNQLIKDYKDILLLLIGPEQNRENLQKLINDLGIKNIVKFKNSMSQREIAPILKRANIHIHPTGGKGLLESAFLGRPVITYDSFSYDYGLIEHMKTGLKAKFRNIESLTGCINLFLKNQNLGTELGEALREKSTKESDWSLVEKKIVNEIESAIIEKNKNRRK